MTPTLYLFDRFDGRLGILPAVGAVTHVEEVGGENTIEFDCLRVPEKGDRLLWRDPVEGTWREHVVVRTDEPLGVPAHVYAELSLCEPRVPDGEMIRSTPQAHAAHSAAWA